MFRSVICLKSSFFAQCELWIEVHFIPYKCSVVQAPFVSSPHLRRICLLILEREEGREGERQTDRQTLMRERNIDRLPPLCALTRDQTCTLDMCPDVELNP